MKDAFGNDIVEGDRIVHARHGRTSTDMIIGTVTGFTPKLVRYKSADRYSWRGEVEFKAGPHLVVVDMAHRSEAKE